MATVESDIDTPDRPVDQAVLGLSKQISAFRDSHGDEAVDAAVALSAEQRKAVTKAEAGQAREAAGLHRDAASPQRSGTGPKTTA